MGRDPLREYRRPTRQRVDIRQVDEKHLKGIRLGAGAEEVYPGGSDSVNRKRRENSRPLDGVPKKPLVVRVGQLDVGQQRGEIEHSPLAEVPADQTGVAGVAAGIEDRRARLGAQERL